jgi:hypothetical protein
MAKNSGDVNNLMVIGIGVMLFMVVFGIWFRFLR